MKQKTGFIVLALLVASFAGAGCSDPAPEATPPARTTTTGQAQTPTPAQQSGEMPMASTMDEPPKARRQ